MAEVEVVKDDKLTVKTEAGAPPVVINQTVLPSGTIIRVVLITLLIIYVAGLLTTLFASLLHLIFMVVLAILFAYLIEPLVTLIQRPFENTPNSKYMPKPLAIGLAYLIVFSVLGIGIAAIAPLAAEQGKEFATKLPTYATTLEEKFNSTNSRYRYRLPKELQDNLTAKVSDFVGSLGGIVTASVGAFLLALVTYLPWLVLIPILAFFFLKDVNLFRISFLRVMPHGDWRTRIEAILEDFNRTLAAYARAQLIACVTIGVLCTVGFYLLGLNYVVLLGVDDAVIARHAPHAHGRHALEVGREGATELISIVRIVGGEHAGVGTFDLVSKRGRRYRRCLLAREQGRTGEAGNEAERSV